MQIFEKRDDLHGAMSDIRQSGKNIGLVPTMGNLHEGHLALIDAAREHCDYTLATIFVNPLQFSTNEDLGSYPRTLEADFEKLASRHCDAVFVPDVPEIYPNGMENQTLITVPVLSEHHCGLSRPGHFSGVCTVVNKLFNLTQPNLAFFGEKDYQQLQIIRKMTADLCMPVNIMSVPTVRADNGLAKSSRNIYLNDEQRAIAPNLYKSLQLTARKLRQGENNFPALETQASEFLSTEGLKVDYFNISNAHTLAPAEPEDREIVILAAAWLGPTRLIDNIRIHIDK